MGAFKEAHGGALIDLYLDQTGAEEEKLRARDVLSWDLTNRQLCDIEMILNGAFSPLQGFLTRQDYDSVVADMRLSSGLIWPMPIMLDVTEGFAEQISVGDTPQGSAWRRVDRAARSRGGLGRDDES